MTGLSKLENEMLALYKGSLRMNYKRKTFKDDDGNLFVDESENPELECEVTDTRDVEMERLKHRKLTWEATNRTILECVPMHVQINAALGLLDGHQTTLVKDAIKIQIAFYNDTVEAIKNAKTPDEVVAVTDVKLELKEISDAVIEG